MPEPAGRTIVITGAAGNVGGKIAEHLRGRSDGRLVLLDRQASDGISVADLSEPNGDWTRHFEGADVVVHAAANPSPHAPWPDLVVDNIDVTLNVFQAAAAAGVRRIVYLSSLQTTLGRDRDGGIAGNADAMPVNLYGVSKSVGERIARSFAAQFGISVVCLRIGMVRVGDNPPPRHHPDTAVQQRWLSNHDLCEAVSLAMDQPDVDFAVVTVTSRNARSPWSLEEARCVLGFTPADRHVPVQPGTATRITRAVRRSARRVLNRVLLTARGDQT